MSEPPSSFDAPQKAAPANPLTILKAGAFTFQFPRPPMIMGILNVTPDSFSDGGRFLEPDAAVEHALRLESEGADILDVGGESTRPNALPVSEEDEWRRVGAVMSKLGGRLKIPVSIDTTKPGVARRAVELGASIVNDVGAGRETAAMRELVAATGVGYVLMHAQGTPQTMQIRPAYEDVVKEIQAFFRDRLARLEAGGVGREQVVLDVGLGFGKTAEHNFRLLAALEEFKSEGRPLLLGASRKSFIGWAGGGAAAEDRLAGSLAAACWAVLCGVQILRVHDVAATRQAFKVLGAIRGQMV